jgi:hypothetical protein
MFSNLRDAFRNSFNSRAFRLTEKDHLFRNADLSTDIPRDSQNGTDGNKSIAFTSRANRRSIVSVFLESHTVSLAAATLPVSDCSDSLPSSNTQWAMVANAWLQIDMIDKASIASATNLIHMRPRAPSGFDSIAQDH